MVSLVVLRLPRVFSFEFVTHFEIIGRWMKTLFERPFRGGLGGALAENITRSVRKRSCNSKVSDSNNYLELQYSRVWLKFYSH